MPRYQSREDLQVDGFDQNRIRQATEALGIDPSNENGWHIGTSWPGPHLGDQGWTMDVGQANVRQNDRGLAPNFHNSLGLGAGATRDHTVARRFEDFRQEFSIVRIVVDHERPRSHAWATLESSLGIVERPRPSTALR
jgi:hypothetical protein